MCEFKSNITKSAPIWASLKQWEKDRCVLIAVENFIFAEHISPSYAELGSMTDISAVSVVSASLRRLARAGYVKLPPHNKTRSLVVLRPSSHMTTPPAFTRRRTARDLLELAAGLLAEQPGADEGAADAIGRWLVDYARWQARNH